MKRLNIWKQIPLSLKIVFILSILWIIGAMFAIPMRYEEGLPFFGLNIYGIYAAIIVLLLDIIGPLIFLVGVWKNKYWGEKVSYIYISIFVLNSIFALFTISNELGIFPILIPAVIYSIFGIIIYKNRKFFK